MAPRRPVVDGHLLVSRRLILFLIFYVQLGLRFISMRSSGWLLAGVKISIASLSFRPLPSTSTVTSASSVRLRTPSPYSSRRVFDEFARTLSLTRGSFQRSVRATENGSPLDGLLCGDAGIDGQAHHHERLVGSGPHWGGLE